MASFQSGAAQPTAAAGDRAGGDLVVLHLYPHGNHAHVGSVIEVTEQEGGAGLPEFLDENRLVFSWSREGAPSGIYLFDVREQELRLIPGPSEGALEPRATPDGEGLSVLQLAEDGVRRHLYRYPLEGGDGTRLLPEVEDIYAYAWVGQDRLVYVVGTGEPSGLHFADLRTGEMRLVQDGVSPVLRRIPGEDAVSFVDRSDPERWSVRRLDGATGEVTTIADAPPGSDDHAWLSTATLLLAHRGDLYRFAAGSTGPWIPLVELGPYLPGPFRFTVAPSVLRLAVVVER